MAIKDFGWPSTNTTSVPPSAWTTPIDWQSPLKSMDPFSAVLGVGSLVTNLIGGNQAAQAQSDAIKAQVAGANFAAQQQADARAAQMAQGLLGMQFGEFIASPRELERQKEAQKFQFGDIAALKRAGESEDWRRQAAFNLSGLGREASDRAIALQQRLEQTKARGAMSGMFGPIASDFRGA